jgi:diaminopimelate epimerase
MFNPDGSEFERSGNGLRVLGAYLFTKGSVALGRPFPVEVGGDRVEMVILAQDEEGMLDVAVDMGRVRFGVAAIGGRAEAFGAGTTLEAPGEGAISVQPVSVGNPHCVVFRDHLDEAEFVRLGPWLASHAAIPMGTNVQFARVLDGGGIEILIWERGVGRTSSSGTSACAVASAAVQSGLLPPGRIPVLMEGGSFYITVSPAMEVRLQGPVQTIMEGALTAAKLKDLTGKSR